MVGAEPIRITGEAESTSGIGLRIAVNQEYLDLGGSKGGSQVDSGCGFANSAFLVCNRYYTSHQKVWGEEPIQTVADMEWMRNKGFLWIMWKCSTWNTDKVGPIVRRLTLIPLGKAHTDVECSTWNTSLLP